MLSLLIKNCEVYDGRNEEGRVMDVGVEGDKIVAIGKGLNLSAAAEINAEGKVLVPGFVDIQNHSDSYWQIFDNPGLDSILAQGFTTIATGNCGASLAPLLSPDALLSIQKWHSLDGANINWQSYAEYQKELSRHKFGCNIAGLVGYSTLRRGIVGDQVRGLEKQELETLKSELQKALDEGAFGLSSGLSYAHEIIISEIEIYELAKIIQKNNALFSVHLRNESSEILESVHEALDISRNTGVKLKISHLKVRDQENWAKFDELISLLETARHKGVPVSFDTYPYDTIWQVLYSYLPKWASEGGRHKLLERMSDEVQRNKILSALNSSQTRIPSLFVSTTANRLNFAGKTISQIAKNMECSSEQAILNIIKNGGSEILVFENNLSLEQVKNFILHPLGMVATDGGGFPLKPSLSNPMLAHPRCFGTSFRILHDYVKTGKMKMGQAVKKLAYLPAETLGLKDRGEIRVGNYADMVLIDMNRINDPSSYTNPYQTGTGIEKIFVNGRLAVDEGKLTGKLSGYVLKRPRQ